ncbi:acyl-CoA dehydrogenase family protein [Bradyrhizobium sp. 188]|uniref:acyl-CoA dehydrogenase family protein n=1 Tax=Bradyrhizobium sp. 188 TaxID=2782656 RepID=UPI001FFBF355|nr:acyl-CoA dehydrogenase family protein [Bradyrhizobium sp. 188]MCK1502132.1 acyl-CoA/acyl-ACP dehydrogenase [Bradyrhizobium sp. 188]
MTSFELQARTGPGRRFVEAIEHLVETFAGRAQEHDREQTFPFENFGDLTKSGVMAAAIPVEHGGLGVESLHDLMVGMSRLGRADGSTAIAANMHIAGGAVIVRMLRRSRSSGDHRTVEMLERLQSQVGAGAIVMCFPTTEPGTDLASPMTEVTPEGAGYRLNGRKIFGTIAPAAHLFFPSVRIPTEGGRYLTGTAMIERGTPGLRVIEDWDAMGMRASGSNSMVFENCFVPKERVFGIRDNYAKVGRGFADFALNANLPLISSFLGLAEAAHQHAVQAVRSGRKGPSGKRLADRIPIQHLVAEMEIDIAVCRALIARLGGIADDFLARYPQSDAPVDESNALMKEVQCMKYVVNRKAIEVVDRAMIACGGASYMSKHPLSRLYRDVRAGPFMQPFAPYEAFEYIGKVALGLEPILDR